MDFDELVRDLPVASELRLMASALPIQIWSWSCKHASTRTQMDASAHPLKLASDTESFCGVVRQRIRCYQGARGTTSAPISIGATSNRMVCSRSPASKYMQWGKSLIQYYYVQETHHHNQNKRARAFLLKDWDADFSTTARPKKSDMVAAGKMLKKQL